MTHLPYIAGAYGLALVAFAWLIAGTMLRLRRSTARLAALETRTRDPAARGA